jgi:AraC-like DNA-binding protein
VARGQANARLLGVKNFVDQNHFRNDLNTAMLAQALGISVRYLHRVFASTGLSFAEYVLRRRLETAASNLRARTFANLSISEISTRSAFSDLAHFHLAFEKLFGFTLGDWRFKQDMNYTNIT